jgi:hypothetical protein
MIDRDVEPVPETEIDRCPTCHGRGEGCTAAACHGLDSD